MLDLEGPDSISLHPGDSFSEFPFLFMEAQG